MRAPRDTTEHARRRNTSLPPVIDRAAVALAEDEGHGVVSRLLQDLVVERAKAVFGPNWRKRFSADEKGRAA